MACREKRRRRVKASNTGLWRTRGVFKHGTSPLAKVLLQSREINKYSCPRDLLHSSFACDALADGRI